MFLVLHGQTEWNRDGKLQGHSDAPLTEEGERQARASGAIVKFHLKGAARIVASPLGRTMATARIIAACLGLPLDIIETDARLAELRLGSWEGLTREQIRAGWPERMESATRNGWYCQSPDGEDYDAMAQRLQDWLGAQGEHDGLIVVSHGIASRVLRGLYAGLPRDEAIELAVTRDAPYELSGGGIAALA